MTLDALKHTTIIAALMLAGALWLRAIVTDFNQDRPVWIVASVICWPCGIVRGGMLWFDGVPVYRRSSASSAPRTPALVRIAPTTA